VTQEFVISITPLGDDEYLVRTERVTPGVPLAEERVKWPVEEWLSKARHLMKDPLLTLLQSPFSSRHSSSSPTTKPTQSLVILGQELYSSLFQGSLRESWTVAQGIAQYQREPLQFRLGLKDKRLSQLPWEVLHAGDRALASNTDIIFSRYQPNIRLSHTPNSQTRDGKIKILIAIAAPSDQDNLKLKREVDCIQQELQHDIISQIGLRAINSITHRADIELTILEQPDREQLTQALEQGKYHVLHYAGHSNPGVRGGELYLVSRRTGLTEILSGDDLAGLLVNNGIEMVVLNSCRGAYQEQSHPKDQSTGERNLSEALINRGIPAVLAMAEHIPDEVALNLTRHFYRNLNQGYPIDLSLGRARAALMTSYSSQQLYWALPILYLHQSWNGDLMGISARETPNLLGYLRRGDISQRTPLEGKNPITTHRNSLSLLSPSLDVFTDEVIEDETTTNKPEKPFVSVVSSSAKEVKANPKVSPSNTLRSSRKKQKSLLCLAFYVIPLSCLMTTSLVGWWFWQSRSPNPDNLLPLVVLPIAPIDRANLEKQSTSEVTAIALQFFNHGKFSDAIAATEALLNREALPQAQATLEQVSEAERDRPEINFLKGRLAWQFVQKGDKNYSVDDARRYWEEAIKSHPQSLKYHNALGFALYGEGNLEGARRVWLDALKLSQSQPEASGEVKSSEERLTPLAGLGLVLMQQLEKFPPATRQQELNNAIMLRDRVLATDPLNFQENALTKNWMWSPKAIQDWRSLQRL
jgi:tetratricopeptide (TPR) repeat protein